MAYPADVRLNYLRLFFDDELSRITKPVAANLRQPEVRKLVLEEQTHVYTALHASGNEGDEFSGFRIVPVGERNTG